MRRRLLTRIMCAVALIRYDDCGEANIQSYVKYFAMKDALTAAGSLDYYSYEPFQVYGKVPFLDLSLRSLTFRYLSLTFHCLSLTFHCLSLTFHSVP